MLPGAAPDMSCCGRTRCWSHRVLDEHRSRRIGAITQVDADVEVNPWSPNGDEVGVDMPEVIVAERQVIVVIVIVTVAVVIELAGSSADRMTKRPVVADEHKSPRSDEILLGTRGRPAGRQETPSPSYKPTL